MRKADDILDLIAEFKARGAPFAVATVVRTVAATAAKAGAKAIITPEGRVAGGWIGGGCARAAVLAAAREALADGKPRLVSIQPKDLLDAKGLRSGEVRKVHVDCRATIGEVGNSEHSLRKIGKAGANRWRGWRWRMWAPTNRRASYFTPLSSTRRCCPTRSGNWSRI